MDYTEVLTGSPGRHQSRRQQNHSGMPSTPPQGIIHSPVLATSGTHNETVQHDNQQSGEVSMSIEDRIVESILQPWRPGANGEPCIVEKVQKQALAAFRQSIEEMKAMGDQLKILQQQVRDQEQRLKHQLKLIQYQVLHQPAWSFDETARRRVMQLVNNNQIEAAEKVGETIRNFRYDNPSLRLEYSFDADFPELWSWWEQNVEEEQSAEDALGEFEGPAEDEVQDKMPPGVYF